MQKLIFLSMFCLLIVFLSGCSDWRLRGSETDPVAIPRLFLSVDNAREEKSTVYRELSTFLGHQKKLVSRQQADIQLILGEPVFDRRTISVNNNLRTAEFQLTLKAPYSILSSEGVILDKNTAVLTRSYRFNEQDIVGKNKEEELLKKEMARDMAHQILRQLRIYLISHSRQLTVD